MIERILCAVDFSEASDNAFQYAADLADTLAGKLTLVHAFEMPLAADEPGMQDPLDTTLRGKLESMKIDSPQVHLKHVMQGGPAGEVICWVAQEENCDLIVMGTHGRSGLTHLIFGSVAEYVLRNSRCPVLTIRQRPENEPRLEKPIPIPPAPPTFM